MRALKLGISSKSSTPKVLGWIFVGGIVAQRLCVWVGDLPIAAAILLVLATPIILWFRGNAKLMIPRMAAFFALVCAITLSAALNAPRTSLPSFLLFVLLYFPFCFSIPVSSKVYGVMQRRYTVIAAIFGLLGVLQYALQFLTAKRSLLFSWAWIVPHQFLIEYNSLNNLHYMSPIFKSNGFFFLEASAVSQLLARTLLIGRYYGISLWILAATLLGIAVTYSGGGMVLVALFAIPLIFYDVNRDGRLNFK
jgi:hypothetical protein